MKFNRIFTYIFSFFICTLPVFAETAVIPYRVENPSAGFSIRMGSEYSNLLGVALYLKKGIVPYSAGEMTLDLKSFNIDPQGTITGDHLYTLGKGRYIDRILLGSIARTGNVYLSRSILFSISRRSVISRSSNTGSDLFECAEKEIAEIFRGTPDLQQPVISRRLVNLAVICDLSYNISRELDMIKKGIMDLAGDLSNGWSNRIELCIIPVSSRDTNQFRTSWISTALSLKKRLAGLKLMGGSNNGSLNNALSYAAKKLSWQHSAVKIILLISNSSLKKSQYLDYSAYDARKRGISIYTVSLGKHGPEDLNAMRQLASIGNGVMQTVTYRQRVYNIEGKEIDIFCEANRFFKTGDAGKRWKDGLYTKSASTSYWNSAPRSYLSEISVDSGSVKVNPYNLAEMFIKETGVKLLKIEPVENNTDTVLARTADLVQGVSAARVFTKPAARVLLTDGQVALWANVHKNKDAAFFSKQHSIGKYFPLGVMLERKKGEPYGLTFRPGMYFTGIPDENIPDMVRTSVAKLAKNPGYYLNNGLLKPPVWFIRVKVERFISGTGAVDVRDER